MSNTKVFAATVLGADRITSLDADGFSVGSNVQTNTSGSTYYFAAFKANSGEMKVSSYSGDGGASQSIGSMGFQPVYVIVFPDTTVHPTQKNSSSSSLRFNNDTPLGSTYITSLDSNGFAVDSNLNSSGVTYHYAAWKSNSGYMDASVYAGTGSQQDITTGFQPEVVIVKDDSASATEYGVLKIALSTNDDTLMFPAIAVDTSGGIANLSTLSNGFRVGTDSYVNTSSESYAYAAFKRQTSTAVKLISFTAKEYGGRVLLRWPTGYEVDNLGFHVYREENGEHYRLTPEPVAGSALLSGMRDPLRAGRTYHWWDAVGATRRVAPTPVKYWLEDIDLAGKRTLYGPVEIQSSAISDQRSPVGGQPSVLLSELGMKLEERYREFWRIVELRERLSQRTMPRAEGLAKLSGQKVKRFGTLRDVSDDKPKVSQASEQEKVIQRSLANRTAIKLPVKEEGWYRIRQPELIAAGLNPDVNPRHFKLFVDGKEEPLLVKGDQDRRFDGEDYIEFYGTGVDTPSTDTRVYWLVVGTTPGRRIPTSRVRGGLGGASSFPHTVRLKERKLYFAALKNGETDNFFGSMIGTAPADQLLNVHHLDPSAPEDALLEVSLQGLTNVPHRVKAFLNDAEVGEITFDGQSHVSTKFSISHSLILEEENLVTLVAQGGESDLSLVDSIELTYRHTYTADDNSLRFTAQAGQQITIDGFSSSGIRIIDITNPGKVRVVQGVVEAQGEGYGVRITVPGSGTRTLLAFTEGRIKEASGLKVNQPSAWQQRGNGADLVIISHKDFMESLAPLVALRESQGWSVSLVDAEDLYDEFNFGHKDPEALKAFLQHAKRYWKKLPRFVLLVGDGSFDPRNHLGLGEYDFVPTKIIETFSMETASDDWFVTFNNEGKDGAAKMPEMAIGRLPVRTAEEATLVVSKIVGYEQGAGGEMKDVLLVADKAEQNGDFDFEETIGEIGSSVPDGMTVKQVFRSQYGSDSEARDEILSSMNQGPLVVNYAGHGSEGIWRGEILSSGDAEGLGNGMRLPFVISMTCFNGLFHDVYSESLAEALLKAPNGGAMAVWASSGWTTPGEQAVMNQELMRVLLNGEHLTLGEVVLRAKAAAQNWDVRRTWILFGDPTTKLKN